MAVRLRRCSARCARSILIFTLSLAFSALASGPPAATPEAHPGVEVASVDHGERGEEVGLQPGDVLLEARAGKTRRPLATPFDVWRVEHDLATLRAVQLTVRREGQTLTLTLPDTEWGLRLRPVLEPAQGAQWKTAVEAADDAPAQALAEALAKKGALLDAAWLWTERGVQQIQSHRLEQAEAAFTQAAARADAAHVQDAAGIVWSEAGTAMANVNNARSADYRARALQQLTAPAVRHHQAAVSLAGTLRYLLKLKEARTLMARSGVALEKLARGRLVVAQVLVQEGSLNFTEGKLSEADALWGKAATLREARSPRSTLLADLYLNRAMVARQRADLAQAQALMERSLALFEENPQARTRLGVAENTLGLIARDRGDYEVAQAYFLKAMQHFEKDTPHGESLAIAGMLHNMGNLARSNGQLQDAERYYQRSLVLREKLAPNSLDVAASLTTLGEIARRQGKLPEADALLHRSLALKEKLAPGSLLYATTLYVLGEVSLGRGLYSEARQQFHQGAAIKARLAPESSSLAEGLDGEARALEAQGDTEGAELLFAAAVRALEAQRGNLPGSEDQRAAFSAPWAKLYHHWAENLARGKRWEEAFSVAERAHASGLLALLAEKKVLPRNQAPPSLLAQAAANSAAFDKAQAALAKAANKPQPEVDALAAKLVELRQARERIEGEIRASSPQLAALANPTPLSVQEVRARLPKDTALIEFSVGKDRTLLFVLTPDGLFTHTLPVKGETISQEVKSFRSFIERGRTHREPEAPLTTLGRSLFGQLLAPALADAPQATRWVIVPDGPLHLLPFSALVVSDKPLQYLAEARTLTLAPSANVYAQLLSQRPPATRQVIAFGDPPHPPEPPLAQGRVEARHVAALFPGAETHLGAEATERTVLARARRARYLHFATHARFDKVHALDSALLLATPAAPTPGDNGLLQAWEVAQKLELDASLVTLSGCDTGLGTVVAGEGLTGLARAFQYAGARAVVVSLWEVADDATSRLMTRFYQGLRQGQAKDDALAAAEAAVRAQPATRHPYYWAAFRLNGDPRPDQW